MCLIFTSFAAAGSCRPTRHYVSYACSKHFINTSKAFIKSCMFIL